MVGKKIAPDEIEFVAIQLGRVAERVANVDQLERTLGSPIHRLEAVDVLSDRWSGYPYCSSYAHQHGGRSLKATEVACFASHIECLRRAATSGAKATVVFEDDAELRSGIDGHFLRDRIAELPGDADFVCTVRQENGSPEPDGPAEGWVRRYKRLPWGTTSLVIFPHTYRLLEPHLLPIAMPIDVFYNWATVEGHIKAYGPADPDQHWTFNGPFKSQLHIER